MLHDFEFPTRPEVVVGPENLDDAGVIELGNGCLLVQTIDFFPPIVDDPRDFGRIAAANALSDIYAMGATPLSALNVVAFPRKKLDLEILGEILAGGAEQLRAADVALLGGHSVEDTEIKYGLAVTGTTTRELLLQNAGAQPGDRLVLTKPLGMGAVSTAINLGKADPEHVAVATKTMATLNAGGATAMREVGCHAATDITGYGLLGHGAEVARASKVTLSFRAADLPLTPGARALAANRVLSGGAARNRSFLGNHVTAAAGLAPEIADIAYDSETSGGLLIAVARDRSEALIAALEREQTPCAVEVGEVLPPRDGVWIELR